MPALMCSPCHAARIGFWGGGISRSHLSPRSGSTGPMERKSSLGEERREQLPVLASRTAPTPGPDVFMPATEGPQHYPLAE